MLYGLLADVVVFVHFLFIVFALLGGFFVLWRWWMLLLHLPTAIWIGIIEFQGWICPLTPLESHLREIGGGAGYAGGFVEHYLIPVIYPTGLTREKQVLLGTIAIAVNLGVYIYLAHRWRRSLESGSSSQTGG
jgi:hypothetical protein